MIEYSIEDTLDYLIEGFQLIGFDWKYLYLNDTVVKQSKYTREELLGYTMMEKYPGIEKTEMFGVLKKCMEERVSAYMENEFTYPDNTKAWFELHMEPVPEGVFIVSSDITKRKEFEKELMQMNESLKNKIELLSSSGE